MFLAKYVVLRLIIQKALYIYDYMITLMNKERVPVVVATAKQAICYKQSNLKNIIRNPKNNIKLRYVGK